MALATFTCSSCKATFQVPAEKIPPTGARGRCKGCGMSLMIYPDGRAILVPTAPPPAAPPPAPPSAANPLLDEPIWKVKLQDAQGNWETRGPLRLADLRNLILEDKLVEADLVQVLDGDWTPSRGFPALGKFFTERLEQLRALHGDEAHCAHHQDVQPGWQCLKCGDYLCEECVANRPLLEGGESRFLCLNCDFETRTLKGKGVISGVFKGILKKK
jgi:predicted Zn finger-like uncharacterized protein